MQQTLIHLIKQLNSKAIDVIEEKAALMSTRCCSNSTLNGPVPGQRRSVFRHFGQDVNASRNSLGRFPSQSEDRSLPSPVSSTASTPHRAAASLLPTSRLVFLQPQNPENMSFLLAAVRLRQSQVMLRARCHVQVRLKLL